MLFERLVFRRAIEAAKKRLMALDHFDSFEIDLEEKRLVFNFAFPHSALDLYPYSSRGPLASRELNARLLASLGPHYEKKRQTMIASKTIEDLGELGFRFTSSTIYEGAFLQEACYSRPPLGLSLSLLFRRLLDQNGYPLSDSEKIYCEAGLTFDFGAFLEKNVIPSYIFNSQREAEIERFLDEGAGAIDFSAFNSALLIVSILHKRLGDIKRERILTRDDFDRHVTIGHGLTRDDCMAALDNILCGPFEETRQERRKADGRFSYYFLCALKKEDRPWIVFIPTLMKRGGIEIITAYNIMENYDLLKFYVASGRLTKASFLRYPEHLHALKKAYYDLYLKILGG